MNRETKIGLVTGVTLIVLIGAMLSSYLSAPRHGIGDLSLAGQGRQLRQQISNPVGIAQVPVVVSRPTAAPAAATATAAPAVAAAYRQPVARYNQLTQLPYGLSASSGTVRTQNTPTVNPEVIPVVVTPIPAPGVAQTASNVPARAQAVVYIVRPGDTLDKIAWHFYHDGGPLAVRRIVNANRGTLTGAKAILRVGETLNIPAGNVQAVASRPQLLTMAASTSGNAYAGNRNTQNSAAAAARPARMRTYRVQSGDTLWGIARKTMGAGTEFNVHRIMTLNHIRDSRTIAVGQILKIP
ncbi:MAG: LysM peptidoglycan-binding domain-containing protein [Phycisphaerae bacterium]